VKSDRPDDDYDYDSSGIGGNRFATVLLYMTGLEQQDGGQTVFDHAWPKDIPDREKKIPIAETVRRLRESGEFTALEEGSWEERLMAKCRTRLAVQPQAGLALLFYSQFPNGTHDEAAFHGACPVVHGTKWVSCSSTSRLRNLAFAPH